MTLLLIVIASFGVSLLFGLLLARIFPNEPDRFWEDW